MPKGVYTRTEKCNNAHKGWHHNLDAKKIMSKIKKEYFISGGSHPMLGKHHHDDSRKKMSNYHKNRGPISEEIRRKISKSHKKRVKEGKNHLWKGGITGKNKRIRNGLEIRLWREKIFRRDKFICQMPTCNKIERYLEAHHIKTWTEYPQLRYEISNGITLCKKCHVKILSKEKEYEKLFTEIVSLKQNELN